MHLQELHSSTVEDVQLWHTDLLNYPANTAVLKDKERSEGFVKYALLSVCSIAYLRIHRLN